MLVALLWHCSVRAWSERKPTDDSSYFVHLDLPRGGMCSSARGGPIAPCRIGRQRHAGQKCKKGYKLVKGKCKKVKKAAPTATPTPTPTATPTPTPLPTATQRTGYKFSGMELNWRNDVCALPNCTCGFFFSLHRVVSGQVCGNAATSSWVLTITDD